MSKEFENLSKEIANIKKEILNISFKVDTMLEILNNFSIMLVEENEDILDDQDDEESWIPKEQDEDWNNYDDSDEDE